MRNDLNVTSLGSNTVNLYIISWDGTATSNTRGLKNLKSENLKEEIKKQLGEEALEYFKDDFINYVLGYILCVNTPAVLNKFFNEEGKTAVEPKPPAPPSTPPVAANLPAGANPPVLVNETDTGGREADSVRFTLVIMPKEFISSQKGLNLSSKYVLGEKLAVRAYHELKDEPKKDPDPLKSKQVLVYSDSNLKGRSRSRASSGGTGIGVWS